MKVLKSFAFAVVASTFASTGYAQFQSQYPGENDRSEFGYSEPAPALAPDASLGARRSESKEIETRIIDEGIFGSNLFIGRFAAESVSGFNPDYIIGVGDYIDLKLWGAVDVNLRLIVDPKGNVFIPKLGPVSVLNVRNGELNELISLHVKRVYRDNVGIYASLANAEPVKVLVSGDVLEPGLYGAYASDSIVHFLDRAGGINTDSGSFLDVRILRDGGEIRAVNLYEFLLDGVLPTFQFRDGDTIFVGPRQSTVKVSGYVTRAQQFEFHESITLQRLLEIAGVDARATHVQLVRNQLEVREADYIALSADLESINIVSGDDIRVFADRRIGDIIVQIEGEFEGLSQFVMPVEAKLPDLLNKVRLSPLANQKGFQLYRKSIASRQKEVLDEMLQKLEESVLAARSSTREEAQLRTQEAALILKFVERAKNIKPKGRLILHEGFDAKGIDLQDQDVLMIPRLTNTVAVQGEVFFPSSFVWQRKKSIEFYLKQAGGLTQSGNHDLILLIRPSGEIVQANFDWFSATEVRPGDEIMVLPKVDTKRFQFSKDVIQILYQLALSAGVVLRL